MIKEITESEVPIDLKVEFDCWQWYFRKMIESQPFIGINWQGQDMNMKAHNSKEEYIEWFASDPLTYDEPYKGAGFYPREIMMLSMWVRPLVIVEMGTSIGVGTRMLSQLNPISFIYSVDSSLVCKHEYDLEYPIGYLVKTQQDHNVRFVKANSWEFDLGHGYPYHCVDLCFIDADHTAESIKKDSETAWRNRNIFKKWAIIWHDYWKDDPRFADYCKAIEDFLEEKKQVAYRFKGMATLWTYGGGQ